MNLRGKEKYNSVNHLTGLAQCLIDRNTIIDLRNETMVAGTIVDVDGRTAAAESLIPDALPGVTVPSLMKHGRSLASPSAVVPCFGYSSTANLIVSLRPATSTGTISSIVERIRQAVVQHRIDHLGLAHFGATAHMHHMRCLGHGLLSARDDDGSITGPDRLIAEGNRFQTGAAQHVDVVRWDFLRYARFNGSLAGRVLSLAGR
uniref:Uncharacterized protein n=1 Tax=Anopheles coluzzii TaxID=1518534 RepID=A0A8W7PMA6_ANOCL